VAIEFFLSAYDPSDLPGGSIDPLGFERGYLFLADKILPGLTNVANRPRYFSMLCAGAYLAGDLIYSSPKIQYQERLKRVLRFERFWALASVFASYEHGENGYDLSGLRGITYAQARADEITRRGNKWVDADYKLLARQLQYGGVGMYGVVAEGMRLWERRTLTLTPDLGLKLAEGFIRETETPREIQKAVADDGRVNLSTLMDWGGRAHINGEYGPTEAKCLWDGLNQNSIRARMTDILAGHPPLDHEESELSRLGRIYQSLQGDDSTDYFKDAIKAILCYENAYQWVQLGLERILWLCRNDQSGSLSSDALKADSVFTKVVENLPAATENLVDALDNSKTYDFKHDLTRLYDVRAFLENASSCCKEAKELAGVIMSRHSDVQHGKFEKGRRKMPWIELTAGDRIALTSTRVGGLSDEAVSHQDIAPHPYRLASADALYDAARSA